MNRLKLSIDYIFERPLGLLYPQEAAIEITNHCNLSCVMCPHVKMTREKGIMDFNLYKKIIDDLKRKTEFVYLYGTGESLLCRNFFDFADYAVKSGMTTCLSTNVSAINEDIAKKLIASGIKFIVLAIDGANKETYNKIRVGADFENIIGKCKMVLREKIRQKARTDINIQLIHMEENANDAKKLRRCFSDEEKSAINHFRIKPFFDSYAKRLQNVKHTCACYFLWNFISITWDGKVQICCMDYDADCVLGDLRESSIEGIWNGEQIQELRRAHRKLKYDDIPICKNCSLPEKKYFLSASILIGSLFNAWVLRKILPFYEKFIIFKD